MLVQWASSPAGSWKAGGSCAEKVRLSACQCKQRGAELVGTICCSRSTWAARSGAHEFLQAQLALK